MLLHTINNTYHLTCEMSLTGSRPHVPRWSNKVPKKEEFPKEACFKECSMRSPHRDLSCLCVGDFMWCGGVENNFVCVCVCVCGGVWV